MKNLNLIRKLAWKFSQKTSIEYDELFSEAGLAYAEALQTFDSNNGAKFTTFAYRCIYNHLINYCKKETRIKTRTSYIQTIPTPDISVSDNKDLDFKYAQVGLIDYQKDPIQDIINEWPEDCQEVVDYIFEAPEKFLGETSNFKRNGTTPKQRVKNKLRDEGWTHSRIQHLMKDMKTAIQTL